MSKWLVVLSVVLAACAADGPPTMYVCPKGFHVEFRQVRLTGEQPTCVSDDGMATTSGKRVVVGKRADNE